MRRGADGEVLARAGWASAFFWVLGMGSRFAFLVWISHGGSLVDRQLQRRPLDHQRRRPGPTPARHGRLRGRRPSLAMALRRRQLQTIGTELPSSRLSCSGTAHRPVAGPLELPRPDPYRVLRALDPIGPPLRHARPPRRARPHLLVGLPLRPPPRRPRPRPGRHRAADRGRRLVAVVDRAPSQRARRARPTSGSWPAPAACCRARRPTARPARSCSSPSSRPESESSCATRRAGRGPGRRGAGGERRSSTTTSGSACSPTRSASPPAPWPRPTAASRWSAPSRPSCCWPRPSAHTRSSCATARLEESTRIAREIHDVLAHALAGLTIQLEATSALIEQGADRDEVLARVQPRPRAGQGGAARDPPRRRARCAATTGVGAGCRRGAGGRVPHRGRRARGADDRRRYRAGSPARPARRSCASSRRRSPTCASTLRARRCRWPSMRGAEAGDESCVVVRTATAPSCRPRGPAESSSAGHRRRLWPGGMRERAAGWAARSSAGAAGGAGGSSCDLAGAPSGGDARRAPVSDPVRVMVVDDQALVREGLMTLLAPRPTSSPWPPRPTARRPSGWPPATGPTSC